MALDWDTIVISAGTAVTAALLAVVGTLVGNRYTQVMRVRVSHHTDLREKVLEPWRERVRVLRDSLAPALLASWSDPDGRVRSPLARREEPFPPSPLLWDRAKEHWPEVREEWGAIERGEKELADALAASPGAAAKDDVLVKASALRARTTRFLDTLDRLIYDRNLEGHCEFCPREPAMARAFRRVVE